MAASWDVALVEEIGGALAQEAVDRDVDVLLAPTVNLHRSPRGGRHFEMFSEDPELTARMAVAYIRGVQAGGVAACVKHYVGNDQEHERFTIDARIDERTLREVYLRPFEAAVEEADVRSLMAAYNYVNGSHACAHAELLQGVLKGEWAFDGVVMSDWNAMKDTVGPAVNGVDLEMPGPGQWWGDGRLLDAVRRGDVPEADVDDKVRRILHLLLWRKRLPGETTLDDERFVDRSEHRALARRAAVEGAVLVKNDGLLPLAPGRSVALIGPGVQGLALLGGGSALLTPHPAPTLLEAFTERWAGPVSHAGGIDLRRSAETLPLDWMPDGVEVELFGNRDLTGEPILTVQRHHAYNVWWDQDYPSGYPAVSLRARLTLLPQSSGAHRLVGSVFGSGRLHVDGRLVADTDTDGFPAGFGFTATSTDLELVEGVPIDVVLEGVQPDANTYPAAMFDVGIRSIDTSLGIEEAVAAATAADLAVVVVGSNDEWESEGQDRESLELPAGQDELIRQVVAAQPDTVVVLNCGAPMLLPWLDQVPAALLAWYPGQEGPAALVDLLTGDAEPGGRMPTSWARHEHDTPSYLHYPGEAGVVRYGEEIYVGHRWYDARRIEPLIAFGHGGSYTTFEWGPPTVTGTGTDLTVAVPVTNTGDRDGSDVLQVYVSAVEPPVNRPIKQLGGFAKVRVASGRTEVAEVELNHAAFRRWDVRTSRWTVDPGSYRVSVGASATDVRSVIDIVLG